MAAGDRVLGLHGAQGIGKTTLCDAVRHALDAERVRTVVMSIDDVYLTRAERRALAETVHPLFATRGVPGTHDVPLAIDTLRRLRAVRAGEVVDVPRFDKGHDDRTAPVQVKGPVDLVLFEGWCVGLPPVPPDRLAVPFNELERVDDPDARWRNAVAAHLVDPYPRLWAELDAVFALLAPSLASVVGWRTEAERAHAGAPAHIQDIARFVDHFARWTAWGMESMPGVADALLRVGRDRAVLPQ